MKNITCDNLFISDISHYCDNSQAICRGMEAFEIARKYWRERKSLSNYGVKIIDDRPFSKDKNAARDGLYLGSHIVIAGDLWQGWKTDSLEHVIGYMDEDKPFITIQKETIIASAYDFDDEITYMHLNSGRQCEVGGDFMDIALWIKNMCAGPCFAD